MKGSKLARSTHGELKKSTIRKDNDFRKAKSRVPKLFHMQKINQQLIKSLNRDIYFFKTRGLLDYSLLYAIEKTDDQTFNAA